MGVGENAHNGAPLVLQEDISSESSMGVNGSLKAQQEYDTRPSKFLDEVLDELDELRWNRVLRSLQALVFSLLPSYWDIASDIWLGITFMTISCGGQYCKSGTPDYFWGR